MKTEALENGVRLIPESEFEREQLKRLKENGRSAKWSFADDWESTGPLTAEFSGPYEGPGGR